jgi:hypothetical protein
MIFQESILFTGKPRGISKPRFVQFYSGFGTNSIIAEHLIIHIKVPYYDYYIRNINSETDLDTKIELPWIFWDFLLENNIPELIFALIIYDSIENFISEIFCMLRDLDENILNKLRDLIVKKNSIVSNLINFKQKYEREYYSFHG